MAQTTICNFGVYLIAVEVRILRRQNEVYVSEEEQGEEAIVKSKAEKNLLFMPLYWRTICNLGVYLIAVEVRILRRQNDKEEQDEAKRP